MANSRIFCSAPWYELHIYWDGSFGGCSLESHKLYPSTQNCNIASMSISEWFNSESMRNLRQSILGDTALSTCSICMADECVGADSRRLKSNQKSVIFTKSAFQDSFGQSPGFGHFNYSQQHQGYSNKVHPIDLHIDLGNYCNLACKMCSPSASSKIASQEVKWGIKSSQQYLGVDWTRDQNVWNSFKQQLLAIPDLNNIHFMGGETLLTPKFEDLVDWFIEHNRTDVCFSFITNGTVFNEQLMQKLRVFKRVGIEISIESLDETNSYQRQGTDTKLVLKNIDRYTEYCNGSSITVTLRPTLSILTIGSYVQLLEYALANSLIIKSSVVHAPEFLSPRLIPYDIKQQYIKTFQELTRLLPLPTDNFNRSDLNNVQLIVSQQVQTCINILSTATPDNSDLLYHQLVDHCRKWDQIYGYNARDVYPELVEIWDRYAY